MKNNFNSSYNINSPNKKNLNPFDIKKYNTPKIKENFHQLNNNNTNNDNYNKNKIIYQAFEENINNQTKNINKNTFEKTNKNSKISNKSSNDYSLYNDIFNKISNLKNKNLRSSSEKSFSNDENFYFSKSNNHNSSKIKITNILNNGYSKTLENDNDIIKNLEKNFDDFFNKQNNFKKNQINNSNKNSINKNSIQNQLIENNKEKIQRNQNFLLNNNKTFDKNQIKILEFKKFNKQYINEKFNQNLTLETENSKMSKQNSFQQKRIRSKENIKNSFNKYSPKKLSKKPLILEKYFDDNNEEEDPYKLIEILKEENSRLNIELTKFKKLSYNLQNIIKNLISKFNFKTKNYNANNKICKNEINVEYYKNNSFDKEFYLFLKENKNLDTNKINYKKLFENTDKTIHNIEVENKYLFVKTKKLKKLIDDFIIDKENNFSYINNTSSLNNTDIEKNNIKFNDNILNQREYFYFDN